MTPETFARNLAASPDADAQAYAVAMIARALSDDDGTRQGWPLASALPAAARYLGIEATPSLIAHAANLAPTISDAELNRRRA